MVVYTEQIEVQTEGHGHTLNLTQDAERWLKQVKAGEGQLTVCVPGSTAAITTIEFEPGALRDLEEAMERLAPSDVEYHHDRRWGDGNGFSHLRAAVLGPSVTIPVVEGLMLLGTWQQLVLVECDVRHRRRSIVMSFVGTATPGDA
ncbi:MAG: secondary thiamine-phosphate synthase enzyme YjbQ [Acidobacteria bacterium]|nr:secondary thiamine-phosphate synthase enzyme YjbQ [Acidobacteriota bacterium]